MKWAVVLGMAALAISGCATSKKSNSCADLETIQPGFVSAASFQPPPSLTVIEAPAANFNERKFPIDMLVLHYTGMKTAEGALNQLTRKESGVSSHYLILEDGTIYRMVPEHLRAWHAGRGSWRGRDDINSRSIGIEIVNGGHEFGLPPFSPEQVDAVIALSRDIISRHNIPAPNIIGHSDMAPNRKEDPGERFPWKRLADAGVGIYPDAETDESRSFLGWWGTERDLRGIGYDNVGASRQDRAEAVTAFQRRWCPAGATGRVDRDTRRLIHQVRRLHDEAGS